MVSRRILLASAAMVGLCAPVRADLVNNPSLFPSASLVTGNCIQATGQNTVASTGTPCGSGTGSGNISGPTSSTIGAIPVWSNGTGTGLADSGVLAANLPTLGGTQTWGGMNTFELRPVFNGQTPYDTGNLPTALAPYLLSATAASTYLTQASAFSTYFPKTGGTLVGNLTAPSVTLSAAAGTWKPISFNTGATQRWQMGSDNAGESGANAGSDFSIFSYSDAGAVLANNLHITRSTGAIAFSARPTFAGNLAWDAGNLNPASFATPASLAAALAPYLLSATAAATYVTPAEVNSALSTFLTIASAQATYMTPAQVNAALVPYLTNATAAAAYATIAGVQSAYLRIADAQSTYAPLASPALTGAPTAPTPATTDSDTSIATTAFVHAAIAGITSTPYDIPWTSQGLNIPVTPIPSSTVLVQYEFVRNVTIPNAFSGSRATARAVATNTTNILVESSRYGVMGNLVFTGGATKPDGIWSITATGPFNFQSGDTLTLVTTESAGNPNITDPTLGGISGTILGALQ